MNSPSTRINKRSGIAWPLIAAALVIASAPEMTKANDSIRLRAQAQVSGQEVHLTDIAQLRGHDVELLDQLTIGQFKPGHTQITVTLKQLRTQLTDQGLNWAKISLSGYARCQIDRLEPDQHAPATQAAPTLANPILDVALDTSKTLRDHVTAFIQQAANVPLDDLGISFSPRNADLLNRSSWLDRYEFQPLTTAPLGRVPIVIRRYRDDQLMDTWRVNADVTRRYLAVMMNRSISRGQTFTPDDVQVREVYLDNALASPMTKLSQVIGRSANAVLRANAVVYPEHLRSPWLVKRGELVTVRCVTGGLVVKTVARASENGVLNQTIQIRSDRSHQTYPVRVIGPHHVMVMPDQDTTPRTDRLRNQPVGDSGLPGLPGVTP